MTATYASPLELVRFLNIEQTIPDRQATGSSRTKETVGTGDGSTTAFYLDKAYVISNSYTLHHGATEASASALVDSTDYDLNLDNSTITLTATGLTTVGTGNIYAEYSYNDLQLTNTQFQDALDRAQKEIDEKTYNHFAVGTHSTPDYISVTNEKHTGKGKYEREYYLEHFPIPDVSTTLAVATSVGATSVQVDSTNGFPNSGYFNIGDEKVPYGSKSSTTFFGITNQVSAAYSAAGSTAKPVYPYIMELSTTSSGTSPDWTVLERDDDYDIDLKSGRIHLYVTDYDLTYYALNYPPRLVPNRFRATYQYGEDTIPEDIKRCCLMLAAKDLFHSTGRRNLLHGQEVNPEDFGMDSDWINTTLENYKRRKHSNI